MKQIEAMYPSASTTACRMVAEASGPFETIGISSPGSWSSARRYLNNRTGCPDGDRLFTFAQVAARASATVVTMDENRARRVVDALRARGVPAHLERAGVAQYGVRVVLFDGRQAIWDTDGTAGLEAQVMRDGVLVGFVPMIEGSDGFDEGQVVDAIARTDYDQPIARQRASAPPPAPALPPEGGFFRRFIEGLRG